jgi:spermidine synthase
MEKYEKQKAFGSFNVKETKNSSYGQTTVLDNNGEVQFFYNGVSQLSLPFEDTENNEKFAYLPLLAHQKPVNVLLFGGSGKYLKEILSFPGVSLDYVEPDRSYISLVKKYWPANLENEFDNSGLRVIYGGGRRFLENAGRKYDVILIGYSDPDTLAVNSFFTREFFVTAKNSLSENGVLAFQLPGSDAYINKYLAGLLNIEKNTVAGAFSSYVILPGESTLFIAKKDGTPVDPAEIKGRFLSQKLGAKFLSEKYIDYKLDPQKQARFSLAINDLQNRGINKDTSPQGLVYSLLYWQEVFAPFLSKAYIFAAKYSAFLWVFIFLWALSKKGGYYPAAFTSGLAAMGLQMIIIFAVQVFYGNIYSLIGVLSALFMAGIAAGAGFVHKLSRGGNINTLKIELVYCLWIVLNYICFKFNFISVSVLFMLSFGTGAILGLELPVIILEKCKVFNMPESKVSGRIYALDLFGSWFSAIVFGAFIIPVWGVEKTLILMIALKLVSFKWFISRKYNI